MINKISIVLILFILGGIGYTLYGFFAVDKNPDIVTLERFNGEEPIMLDQYIGKKKTILQFVAVPCECCSFSMPFIQQFAKEQDDIEVITIIFYGKRSEIQDKFENEYKATHLYGLDLDRSIANHYGATVSPTYVFLDEEGNNLGAYPYIILDAEELLQRYDDAFNKFHNKGE
ncbi:TlpA family protein disulfide reductase [Anaerobacillus isosaccharinicus]|uniref:Redoxin family protein n=1 Tax=Anaerobacillus isosaccharinicus TaxID=1532552 RepID=A0A1S2M628_9BACI|nr:redoxin family protein [Anaerobacillus isosaccharinicus]MBA5587749.1 redoxin family protein [Anaerobacillus isosaccharinicus]QOY34091.1 redoxin family protein [Anaerobacillus isosaccharinicus]